MTKQVINKPIFLASLKIVCTRVVLVLKELQNLHTHASCALKKNLKILCQTPWGHVSLLTNKKGIPQYKWDTILTKPQTHVRGAIDLYSDSI